MAGATGLQGHGVCEREIGHLLKPIYDHSYSAETDVFPEGNTEAATRFMFCVQEIFANRAMETCSNRKGCRRWRSDVREKGNGRIKIRRTVSPVDKFREWQSSSIGL